MKSFASALYGHWSHNIHHPEYYFSPGLTFSRRTASGFNPRVLPSGCLFGEQGPTIFPQSPFNQKPLALLAICHSRLFQAFVDLLVASGDTAVSGSAARTYERGVIGKVPLVEPNMNTFEKLEIAANEVVDAQRRLDAKFETSRFFERASLCPFVSQMQPTLHAALLRDLRNIDLLHLKTLDATFQIESLVLDLYGLHSQTKRWIDSEFGIHPNEIDQVGTVPLNEFRDIWNLSDNHLINELVSLYGGSRFITKKSYFSDRKIELLCYRFSINPRSVLQLRDQSVVGFESEAQVSTISVLSYFLGCFLGRWDVRIFLDPSLAPKLPDPFDPLPVCPPGMLVGPDGLPAEPGRIVSEEWLRARPDAGTLPPEGEVKNPTGADSDYPLRISWDGVLVDDPGFNGTPPHREDIVRRVREVLDLLWKDKAPDIEQEACDILGVSDLRDYFSKPGGFFQDHLKLYSKSRRKAPIYWPLSTASASYTVWLYYHRLTDQTLYAIVNQYVEPKIAEVERGLARIENELPSASGRDAAHMRDRLHEGRTFLDELRDFREELLRVAALPYKPNLNDGVIINAAPLHKLFRLRSWANDTEECWKKLQKSDYDWAHLAYTTWPDRVQEVCKKDRSIAIAHGLEDLCEVKAPAAKQKGGRRKKESAE